MRIYYLLLSALFILGACNKPTKIITMGTESQVSEATKAIFPHTPEFKTTRLHGEVFFQDRGLCANCHEVSGTSARVSCHNCHPYPHKVKWTLPENHGQSYVKELSRKEEDLKDGEISVKCLQCHAENGSLATKFPENFVSCGSCHTPMPHTSDFMNGDHGDLARTYKGKCTVCHTDQKRLMPDPQGCYACHSVDHVPTVQFPF